MLDEPLAAVIKACSNFTYVMAGQIALPLMRPVHKRLRTSNSERLSGKEKPSATAAEGVSLC